MTEQLSLIRQAVGPDMGIHLDINFNFKTEGFKRIAEAVAPVNLADLSGRYTMHSERKIHEALAKTKTGEDYNAVSAIPLPPVEAAGEFGG